MAAIRPRDLLTDDLLQRLGGYRVAEGSAGHSAALAGLASPAGFRQALASGRTTGILVRDIARLRDIGYFKIALPTEFGGMGCTLRQAACAQRQLTYRAPCTALAVSSHLHWTGAAADAYRSGDTSVKWILLEAARGALFGGGHGLPGSDLHIASTKSRCAQAGESGYRFRSPGVLASLTPGWDWMAVHAVTDNARQSPEAILAFAGRGSRCTPSYRVARVLPAGSPADVFTTSAMGWGFSLLGSIQYAIARSAFNSAVRNVARHLPPTGSPHPLDRWPVAEASLRLDTIKSRIADVTHVWLPHEGRSADPGGRELIKILTMRHEVADGARRVLDLITQITDAPADSAPAAVAR